MGTIFAMGSPGTPAARPYPIAWSYGKLLPVCSKNKKK